MYTLALVSVKYRRNWKCHGGFMEVGAVEDGSLALGASTAGSGGDLHTDRTGETLVDGTVPPGLG